MIFRSVEGVQEICPKRASLSIFTSRLGFKTFAHCTVRVRYYINAPKPVGLEFLPVSDGMTQNTISFMYVGQSLDIHPVANCK